MNKKWMLISSIVIILVIIGVYFYFTKSVNNAVNKEKILEIIKPEIEQYCSQLNTQAINSGCPTCRIKSYNDTSEFSKSLDIVEYIINKEEKGYTVSIRIPTIYGWNTRSGQARISFELDKDYGIINKNLTLASCI